MGKPTGGGGVQAKAGAFSKGDVLFMRDAKGGLYRAGAVSITPDRDDKRLVYNDEKGRERRVHPLDLYHSGGRVLRDNTRLHIVPPKGTMVAVKSKTGQVKYRIQKGDEWKRSDDITHRIVTKDLKEYENL